jgi:hypothetical protein
LSKKARGDMCKETKVRLLFMVLLLVAVSIGATLAYADSSVSAVSGRLGATYDAKSGNVTAMVAGYCEGKAVTLGPVTWAMTENQFSNLKADKVAKAVCGEDCTLQRITSLVFPSPRPEAQRGGVSCVVVSYGNDIML